MALNNLHLAIHYQEAMVNQIGLQAQYIQILCQEYSMMHRGNPPPLNFEAQITEAAMKRAKGMYENAIKSLDLPRQILGAAHIYIGKR